jgi:hypothetical protein
MSTDRVSTTPAQIHDAIETQIPYRFRAEVVTIFADLQSKSVDARENAIVRGHAVASQLKAIAESQSTPGLHTDAEPSACLKVSSYIYAAMDAARQRAPSPYPSGSVNDGANAYEVMRQNDQNAWRGSGAQTADSKPTQIGDTATEYEKMLERDRNAWNRGA